MRPGSTCCAPPARRHFPQLTVIARARDMRHLFELRDLGVDNAERETFRAALSLGESALAAVTGDAERARRAAQAFAEHDRDVEAKLYGVHRQGLDAHISASNELRDQFERTLAADEATLLRDRGPVGPLSTQPPAEGPQSDPGSGPTR